ncbi:MAG: hypothetical protein U0Q16_19825 [Bryobacteraceae bacterium]
MRFLAFLIPMALLGGEFEFDDAIRHMEDRLETRRLRIPLLGLATGVAGLAAAPFGAESFRIAIFDHVDAPPSARAHLFPQAPEGWRTVLRVREQNGEHVTMFCRDEGSWARLMMVVLDRHDAVLMQFKMRPTRLLTHLAERARREHSKNWHR